MTDTLTTTPRLFCFVLMPFNKAFHDIYEFGIKGACDDAGTHCERVDQQIYDGTILQRIYNQIAKADIIIADMTGQNPNVFYEVGYAHALGKTTVLVTKDTADIPFDMKHFPHIVYGDEISTLRKDLIRRLKSYVASPPKAHEAPTIDIDLYLGDTSLASGDVVYEYKHTHHPCLDITVQNRSSEVFEDGACLVGVLTSERYETIRCDGGSYSVQIPGGGVLHMLPDLYKLLPQAYTVYNFTLCEKPTPKVGYEERITLRVFTHIGTRDYPLTLRCIESKGE